MKMASLWCIFFFTAGHKFRFREDSLFSFEESKFIVLHCGELKYAAAVRMAFGTKFYPKNHMKVTNQKAFLRVTDRLLNSVRTTIPDGSTPPEKTVQ